MSVQSTATPLTSMVQYDRTQHTARCCVFIISLLFLKKKRWFFHSLNIKNSIWCQTVDFTSVDTRSSEREAATFTRMHEITSAYQRSTIYQSMLEKMEQSLQRSDKPAIPFKSKESPSGAAKLGVLLRSVCLYTPPINHYLKLKYDHNIPGTNYKCHLVCCFIKDM